MEKKKNKITISQGLANLKLLDKKIIKKTRSTFIGIKVAGKVKEAFDAETAKSDLDSFNALVTHRVFLKNCINISNGITEVIIAGVRMTVSEAINKKEEITYKETLLARLKSNFANATSSIDYNNAEILQNLDIQLQKVESPREKEEFTKIYMKSRQAELVDPIGLAKYIEVLEEEIMNFTNEVDYILSTSNATTTITV